MNIETMNLTQLIDYGFLVKVEAVTAEPGALYVYVTETDGTEVLYLYVPEATGAGK